MRLRAFGPAVHGFLDTIREGHPNTPLLVVSPIYCPIHEDTPGPAAPDYEQPGRSLFRPPATRPRSRCGRLTLEVIRSELRPDRRAAGADDPNLYYLDGRELYGEADDAELPLPDALHPDAETHRLIGEHFAAHAFAPDGPFAATTGSPSVAPAVTDRRRRPPGWRRPRRPVLPGLRRPGCSRIARRCGAPPPPPDRGVVLVAGLLGRLRRRDWGAPRLGSACRTPRVRRESPDAARRPGRQRSDRRVCRGFMASRAVRRTAEVRPRSGCPRTGPPRTGPGDGEVPCGAPRTGGPFRRP